MGLTIRLILLFAVLLAGCAGRAPGRPAALTAPLGSFLSQNGTVLPDAEIARLARSCDFILMGESHTNPCDHAVQARLVEVLGQTGMRFIIGLEMLPVTVQPALDAFNSRQTDADELEHKTQWEKHWGHAYSMYRPMLETARRFDLPVAALNIPRETLLRFRDGNPLTAAEQAMLPRVIPVSPAQKKSLSEQVAMHQAMRAVRGGSSASNAAKKGTDERTRKFFLVQSLWDSMMAGQALKWRNATGQPVLILAGSGHVEQGWGIEHRLRALEPGVRCLRIMPARDKGDLKPAPGASVPEAAAFFACAARNKSRLGMTIIFEGGSARLESVEPGSTAAEAGLMPGDVILRAGDKPLKDASNLHFAAMAAARKNAPLALTVRRAGKTVEARLPLGSGKE